VTRHLDSVRAGVRRWATAGNTRLGLAEFGLYVVLALVVMWPVPLHLASRFAGGGDPSYYFWLNWAVGQMIRHGHLAWHIPGVVYPVGSDIRLLDGQLPTLIGGLFNAVFNPFLAFNLGLVTGTLLNCWAGRRIGRLFSPHRQVWILTAVAFATAPCIAQRLRTHFTLYFAFAAALLVEEAVRVARGDHPVRPVRLGLLLFLAYLCGVYFLVFGGLAYVLIVGLSSSRVRGLLRNAGKLAAGLAIGLVLVSPFLVNRLTLDRFDRAHGYSPVMLSNMIVAESDGYSIVTQSKKETVQLPGQSTLRANFRGAKAAETVDFPGYLLLAAIAGLILLRFPLRWPLLVTAMALWILTLGPSPRINGHYFFTSAGGQPVAFMPYTALAPIPGLGTMRVPTRASFAMAAVLSVPFALSAHWLFGRLRSRWQRWTVYAVAAGLVVTSLGLPVGAARIEGDARFHHALEEVAARTGPGQSMVTVPADCVTNGLLLSVYFQVLHRTPLVGCQASSAALPWQSVYRYYAPSAALASLRCQPWREGPFGGLPFTDRDRFTPAALAALRRELGVRFLLVGTWALAQPRCARLRSLVPELRRRYDVLGEDQRWILIDTAVAPGTP
jgi:hypothetical protein